jgi:hypothetical protein
MDIGKEMMIYPTQEKEILDMKYYHFLRAPRGLDERTLFG